MYNQRRRDETERIGKKVKINWISICKTNIKNGEYNIVSPVDEEMITMKQVYPVIFTKIQDEKNTILIEVPDLEILTEGFGIVNAIDMARDAIGVKGYIMTIREKNCRIQEN